VLTGATIRVVARPIPGIGAAWKGRVSSGASSIDMNEALTYVWKEASSGCLKLEKGI
jgi:hypothetical protein